MTRNMILAAGVLCLMLGSCAAPAPAESLPPTAAPAETTLLPAEAVPAEAIPLSAVKTASAEEFAAAGIPLKAPNGTINEVYEWDGEVAQVRFTTLGPEQVEQVFRGGRDKAAVERDAPLTEEGCTICACGAYYSQTTEERTCEDGGKVELWSFGDLYFSLYTAPCEDDDGTVSPFTLGEYVANCLDERTWLGTMGADEHFFPEQTDAELILTHVTARGLTLQIENHRADEALTYGVDYELWKLLDGEWRRVPWNMPRHMVGGPALDEHEDTILELDWTSLYGELAPGSYRMTKSVLWGSGGAREETTVYAGFTIE